MAAIVAVVGGGIGAIIMGFMTSSVRPLHNALIQNIYRLLPNELIPPTNLISMKYKGLIEDDYFYRENEKQGISNERADLLYQEAELRLNSHDVINLWRRGQIDEEQRNVRLGELGITESRINDLVNITTHIPSASDIIGFAVREVYSPEIAERFGQFDGVDGVMEKAKADLVATGFSEDLFRKYWAAHWRLPSIGQGYEMVHRDIIEGEDLDKLMEAQDIMPWWRAKLKAMSFNPLTRVDVRRMHKLGLIDEDQLTRSYMDLGYDEEKAKMLTQFTIVYNGNPESAEMTEEDQETVRSKEATRAAIINSYKNRIVDQYSAVSMLQDLGFTDQAIALYIAIADFDLEEEITEERIESIHQAYVRRIWDLNQTVAKIGELNLPAKYQESLLDRWNIEREAKPARPSKAELFKLFANNIIDESTLRVELTGQGYDDRYISWYVELNKKS